MLEKGIALEKKVKVTCDGDQLFSRTAQRKF